MTRVNLVGPAEDGLHIVVESDAGERFELAISDELRHAVRYARPRPAWDAADDPSAPLSPKEIQQRIRAGLTAAELAELTGAPRETLEKFEPPVIAERNYIAELARTTRIGRDPSAPVLGELVIDRLAGRGVDQDDIIWDYRYQLADLSRLITLEPGDIVLTGTPANSRPMQPGDVVEVEIEGLPRLTNTVVDWDVDLSGPGDQLQVSANTLHVALAIPEDEAELRVREGRLEP